MENLNLNLKKKIIDSNYLVQSVVTHKAFGFKGTDRVEYSDLPKNYIIVFDFESAKEFLFGSFSFLAQKTA